MARPSQPSGVVSRLGLALMISVLAGLLVAGLAVPVIGGIGLSAKAGTEHFLSLPTQLETPALATRSTVLASDGSLLATFYSVNRVEAPLASVPVSMRQAIVAIEDSRFYEHNGVDYKGTLRAAVTNLKSGGVSQGGSTLTQQYVKNALIAAATDKAGQQAAVGKTADRKLQEARYALELEKTLSKDEILHRYLDIAYFGNQVYGIGTAATYYYGEPVDKLTLSQSATLAGVVQNPGRYDVASKDPAVLAGLKERRDTVLGRMRDLGYITEQVRAATAAEPLAPATITRVGQGCEAAGVSAPFYCDYVRHELEATPVGAALGSTLAERQAKLLGGGLTIRTNLDPRVQAATQQGVDKQVPNGDANGVATASDVVEPGTGAIRAMAVDRGFGQGAGQTQVNIATGGQSGFQAGSTFKVFWLATALQEGLPLSTRIYSPAKYVDDNKLCPGADFSNAGESEAGTYDLRSATADSVNTYFIQLMDRIGVEKPLQLAEAMGVRRIVAQQDKPLARVCSSVLGANEVSPLAMAGAYAGFANHGLFCPPRAVASITGPSGKQLAVPANTCTQVIDPAVADTVTQVLTGVVTHGTGTGASIGRPAAGKTGTTNDSTAAWFVGYTPQYAASVWLGRLPKPLPMTRIRINGRSYAQVFGGSLPAPTWRAIMQGVLQGLPVKGFQPADPTVATGTTDTGKVPDVTRLSYSQAVAALTAAGFAPTAGRTVPSTLSAGRVVYTSPRAGRSAPQGATVYVYRSSGAAAPKVVPKATTPPATAAPAGPTPAASPTR